MKKVDKYQVFVEVVKTGSLTAAAFSLNYTQPGISHIINDLEKEFGFQLFNREKRGVSLTEAGHRIYLICHDILAKQNELESVVRQINGSIIGTLRIGSYLSVLTNWMPNIIKDISQRYPQLELHLFEGDRDEQLTMLRSHTIDVGIFSSSAPEEYKFIPICQDPAVAILPPGHALSKKEVLTADDLLSFPMLVQPESASDILKRVLGEKYIMAKGNYVVKSDLTLLRLVESGFGIGVVGSMVVSPKDNVVIRRFDKSYCKTIGLAFPKWKPITPAINAFVQIVCSLYQEESFVALNSSK